MDNDIPPKVLYSGRTKALDNSKRLRRDAGILFRDGSFASAFFLVQISTEELGKYSLIVSSSISALHGSLDWKRFWKRFRSHKNKTEVLLSLKDLYDVINKVSEKLINTETNRDYASLQDEVKMKSLYSDYTRGDGFSSPSSLISEEVCRVAIQLLDTRIEMVEKFEVEIASKMDWEKLSPETIAHWYQSIGVAPLNKT